MNDTITLRGTVGTDPRQIQTATGLDITSFRLASTQRRFDREKQEWVDSDTNWYGISTYRQLARNTGASVKKGDPVIVTGRVKVRPWEAGEKKGLSIEVDADSVGHDLLWGTSVYTRSLRKATLVAAGETQSRHDEANGDDGSTTTSDGSAPDVPTSADPAVTSAPVPTPF